MNVQLIACTAPTPSSKSAGQSQLTATPEQYRADFDREIEEIKRMHCEHLFCNERGDVHHWYPEVWPTAIFTINRDGVSTDFVDDMMNYGTNGLPFGFYAGDIESFGKDTAFIALAETRYYEAGGEMMPVADAIALAIRRLTTYPSQSK